MRRGGALAVFAALIALLAAAPAPAATPLRCNGEFHLCKRTFDRVVLPATHNSMSAQSLGWAIPNQQVDIPTQLAAGVRGFLLDTYYGHRRPDGVVVTDPTPTPDSRLYLCHVACALGATPLVEALASIRSFLVANPNNVLAIINEDSVSPADFEREVRASGLFKNVYRGAPGPRWPTLAAMIQARQQVLVLAERNAGAVPWYHRAYDGILQETGYSWASPDQIVKPANWSASCAPNRGGRNGSLFLMNHWSPPVAPTPAGSAVVNAAEVLVGRAEACRAARGLLPTIVAVDMFPSGGLLEAVRWLNAARR